jgi:hypothetical protein
MGKSKNIYLLNGSVEGWKWRLRVTISASPSPKYQGGFDFQKKTKHHTQKTIHLTSGTEDEWGWQLNLNLSVPSSNGGTKYQNWSGTFYLTDELRKYRSKIRRFDRYWAQRSFPRQWRHPFEIHHDWSQDAVCYFLSKEEHRKRDISVRINMKLRGEME